MKAKRRSLQKASRWIKRFWKLHWTLILIVFILFFFLINWVVQSVQKPSEVIGLAEGPFFKSPIDTWKAYGDLFEKHSTPICSAPFLAALAQTESSGNPIARTYWVWRWSFNPFEIYQPASSSMGLYQITDGTFEEEKELCIHNGKVARVGHWNDWDSCWFNGAYNRLIPSHAIEMTSAYLQLWTQTVTSTLRKPLTLKEARNVAAMIHLCGLSYVRSRVRNRFRVGASDKCAGTRVGTYVRRVQHLTSQFNSIAAENRIE